MLCGKILSLSEPEPPRLEPWAWPASSHLPPKLLAYFLVASVVGVPVPISEWLTLNFHSVILPNESLCIDGTLANPQGSDHPIGFGAYWNTLFPPINYNTPRKLDQKIAANKIE